MKRPDNTEMDRLLRRHARLGGGAVRGAAPQSGAHMDADEMNAYAEGALPEAARSRYFSHLADCDSCRKLVTELTLAASAAAEGRERVAAAQTAAPSKSWRERLAAILSPQVLRYAVPALALFAVVIIAIVAMRTDRGGSSVARNEQNTTATAPPAGTAAANSAVQQTQPLSSENHANGNAGAAPVYDGQTEKQSEVVTDATTTAEKAPADKDNAPAPQATPAPKTDAQFEDDRAPSRESDQPTGGRRAQEEVAASPPPPPQPAQEPVLAAPSAAGETSARDEQEQRKTKAERQVDGTDVSTTTAAKSAGQNRERRDVGRAEGGGPTSTRAGAPMASKRPPGGVVSENEAPSDTRIAGSRSFRRQDGAWVDTAYNPSRPKTKVRRASEQYRTLVADEPGLRDITNQLDGEVIVVWKKRAYHFY